MLEICEEGRNLMLSFKLFPTNVYVREDCEIDYKKLIIIGAAVECIQNW